MRPAVFLDRDDTLIANSDISPRTGERAGDLSDPDRVRLLEGALDGCRLLKKAGLVLVIFTNQGVVARGGATLENVEATNDRVCELLVDEHGQPLIDAVYFCPFHPDGSVEGLAREHPWRKPAPGMILEAAKDLRLDLNRCWVVGDSRRDIEAGRHAGIDESRLIQLDERTPDVASAALWIVASLSPRQRACLVLRTGSESNLCDEAVRETLRSSAEALGERTGIRLLRLWFEDDAICVEIEGSEFVAVGFAAELRRLTDAWHRRHFSRPLWPAPSPSGGEP